MSIHVAAIGNRAPMSTPVLRVAGLLQPDRLFRTALAVGWVGVGVAAFSTMELELAGLAAVLSLVAADYLGDVGRRSRREGLAVGSIWLAISAVGVAASSTVGLDAVSLGLLLGAYLVVPAVAARVVGDAGSTSNNDAEPTGDPGTASGPSNRPTNFVAAVLHDKVKLDQAIDELVAIGIGRDSIGVLYGEAGVSAIAHRPRRWFRDLLSDDDQYMQRFEAEIREGGFVVGVPLRTGSRAEREAVRDILWRHGAHAVVSRGRWTFTIDD